MKRTFPETQKFLRALKIIIEEKYLLLTSAAQLASTQYILAMSIIVCSYQNI